jgi:tetratricopeptide (TPR) repeat protein
MEKYRVRLKNGRVIGPLILSQLAELKIKNYLTGDERYQIFPTGEWLELSSFPEIAKTLANPDVFYKKENTILVKLDELNKENEQVDNTDIELEKIENTKSNLVEKDKSNISIKNPDKTIVTKDTLKYLDELKQQEIEKQTVDQVENDIEDAAVSTGDIVSEATQMFDLSDLRKKEKTSHEEEINLDLEEKKVLLKQKKEIKKKLDRIKSESIEKSRPETEVNNKKKVIYAIIGIIVLIVALLPEQKKKEEPIYKPIFPIIKFPLENTKINQSLADEHYQVGLKLLSSGSYIDKVSAAQNFLTSIEAKYIDNLSLPKLLLTYVDLLKYSSEPQKDGNVVFQMLQVFFQKYIDNVDMNNAYGMYFYTQNMPDAAYVYMKKYLDLGKNPTIRYFSDLIEICISIGKFSEAKSLYNKIKDQEISQPHIFIQLYHYELVENNTSEAFKWLSQGLEKYPQNVSLMFARAHFETMKNDYKSLAVTLNEIENHLFGQSERYRSLFYAYKAFLAVLAKNVAQSNDYLEKASLWHDKSTLNMLLKQLDQAGLTSDSKIFKQAKADEYIKASNQYLKQANFPLALLNATNAIEIARHYAKGYILQAEIYAKTGFYQKAIESLVQIKETVAQDPEINFTLLSLYIETYKFSDAIKLFNVLGVTDIRHDYRYYSYNAAMYFKMGKLLESIKWLQDSLQRNPLNHKDYYLLGEILFRRKSLTKAKSMYNKAIELNPMDPQYKISYSRVIYEESGADVAIGYLRDLLRDYPSNPQIMGEIAINYYKSGQVSYYQGILKEIQELPQKDKTMYEFLIKSAELNDNLKDVIAYSEKLLEIDPGDLRARIYLAELLIEMQKYDEATDHLMFMYQRLETYPRLLYNLSRLSLLAGDKDKAMNFAKREIESNPGVEDGFILLGNINKEEEKFVDAERNFAEALKINPNSIDALAGMAFVHVKRNNLEAALDLYQKAIRLSPNKPTLRKSIGDVYRMTGQSAQAIEHYKIYLELLPNTKFKAEVETYIRNFD